MPEAITREGLIRLNEKLAELTKKRGELSKTIAWAASNGDLSENADYHAAKEAQRLNEVQIGELTSRLANMQIVEIPAHTGLVQLGSKVTLKDLVRGSKFTYEIVVPEEADFDNDKISMSSPVALGLRGKKAGDTVEIKVPSGMLKYEIISVAE